MSNDLRDKGDEMDPLGKQVTINTIVNILCIDGAHHKQYGLEMALEMLVGAKKYRELKQEHQWETGIPP